MSNETPRSVEQASADMLERAVAGRVRRLRDLTDEIEREAARNLERARTGEGTYSYVPSMMQHSLTWGMANTNLETLFGTAIDADIAHAKDE